MAGSVLYVNDENFKTKTSAGVVLVDFYADWCGPCRMMTPIVEELARELDGKATICKLDIESAQQTTAEFQVTSIPTIIIFKEGKEVKRIVGLKDIDSLRNIVTAQF